MSTAEWIGLAAFWFLGIACAYWQGYTSGDDDRRQLRRDLDNLRERYDRQKALVPPHGTHYVETSLTETTRRNDVPRWHPKAGRE